MRSLSRCETVCNPNAGGAWLALAATAAVALMLPACAARSATAAPDTRATSDRAGPGGHAPAAGAGTAPARAGAPSPATAPALGPVLAARDLDGRVVGPLGVDQEAAVVVVFASWCGPCRHELAVLGELRQELPRARIIGVNAYEEFADRSDEERLRGFLAENAPWLQVVRADGALMDALGRPRKIPSVYVFDRRGGLVAAFLRARRAPPTKAELAATIAEALP